MPPLPNEAGRAAAREAIQDAPTSRGFASLLLAFRLTGGTARGDDVARLLEDHPVDHGIGLDGLIESGAVFGFTWRATTWIPMFQFEHRDLSVRPELQTILNELGPRSDDWARAAWFAKRNAWLHGRRPVDVLGSDLADVLSAARADRFIAVG